MQESKPLGHFLDVADLDAVFVVLGKNGFEPGAHGFRRSIGVDQRVLLQGGFDLVEYLAQLDGVLLTRGENGDGFQGGELLVSRGRELALAGIQVLDDQAVVAVAGDPVEAGKGGDGDDIF